MVRRTPPSGQLVTGRTTLAELFEMWLQAKELEDGIKPQTADAYRAVWRAHGAGELGALRVTELQTGRANKHLKGMGPTTQA
jgi:hypothetical protein